MLQFPTTDRTSRRLNKLALRQRRPVQAVIPMSPQLVSLVEERLRLHRTLYAPAQQAHRERQLAADLVGIVQTFRSAS